MTLFTKYVQNKVDSPGLNFFFWTGIILVGIGAFKLIILFIFGDKSNQKTMQKNIHEKTTRIREQTTMQERKIIVCQRCGTKHYSNSNYCHMCGVLLKKY